MTEEFNLEKEAERLFYFRFDVIASLSLREIDEFKEKNPSEEQWIEYKMKKIYNLLKILYEFQNDKPSLYEQILDKLTMDNVSFEEALKSENK